MRHLFDSLLQRNSILPEVSFGQGWRVCQRGLANDPATSGNRWILAAGPGRATLLHYHRSHDVLLPAQHLQEKRARVVRSDAKQKEKRKKNPPAASCCYAARKTY